MKRLGIVAGVLVVIVGGLGTWFLVWRGRMVAEWEREQAAGDVLFSNGGYAEEPVRIIPERWSEWLGNPTYVYRRSCASGNGLRSVGEQELAIRAINDLRHLRRLNLAGMHFDASVVRFPVTELRSVILDSAVTPDDPLLILELGSAQRLTKVWASGTLASDRGIAEIARCRQLESLHLSATRITSSGICALGAFGSLKDLDISLNRSVGDTGMSCIGRLSGLQRLNLRATQVSNEGLRQLRTLEKLRELDLRQTLIDDRAVENICDLPKHIVLHVSKRPKNSLVAPGLSEVSIERIRERRSDIDLGRNL